MSVRETIVAVVGTYGSMSSLELRNALEAQGIQPSNLWTELGALVKAGRLVREGGAKKYRYRVPAQAARQQAAEPAPKATPPVVTEADAQRQRLAEVILQHVTEAGRRISAEDIAADLDEERRPVALAIAELMRAGKLSRHVSGDGRWEYELRKEAAPKPAVAAKAAEPEKVRPAEPEKAQPVAAEKPAAIALSELVQGLERLKSQHDTVLEFVGPVGPDRLGWLHKDLREMSGDIEDLIGAACDDEAPHPAIKALVVAHGGLRRALEALGHGA